mmetsp:Transcript_50890/g.89942  ORF Transcript_50890/g.89942 Transcript_50890/m.89942 type:complete len:204 (-) Transcript_50890:391-1002(-)
MRLLLQLHALPEAFILIPEHGVPSDDFHRRRRSVILTSTRRHLLSQVSASLCVRRKRRALLCLWPCLLPRIVCPRPRCIVRHVQLCALCARAEVAAARLLRLIERSGHRCAQRCVLIRIVQPRIAHFLKRLIRLSLGFRFERRCTCKIRAVAGLPRSIVGARPWRLHSSREGPILLRCCVERGTKLRCGFASFGLNGKIRLRV